MSDSETILTRKKVVFVVDDDPGVLRACERMLNHAGYHVVTAPNGAFALRTLALTSSIDLLLCDVFMPEKDGFETIETVRRKIPSVPIIAMSGGGGVRSPGDVLAQCAKLGARTFLTKPFSGADLTQAVAEIIGPAK
jgi:CheY-like chemotaxis protein